MKNIINNINFNSQSSQNLLQENKWKYFLPKAKFSLLSNLAIEYSIKQFWNMVMKQLPDNKFVNVLFRIENKDGIYKTLGTMCKVDKKDYKELLENYKIALEYKENNYLSDPMERILFSYYIIPNDKLESSISKINLLTKHIKSNLNTYSFGGYKFPNTMDFDSWGEIILSTGNVTLVKKQNSKDVYKITREKTHNLVQLKDKNKKVFFEFTDYLNDPNNLGSFTRKFLDYEYIFIDNELIVKKLNRKTKFIKGIKNDKETINNFITLDIETRVINNVIKPYCVCYFDGKNSFSFYLTDFNNEEALLKETILSLFNEKYHNFIIYIHNLSYFDGIFLLKSLSSIDDIRVKPLMKDGKIFNIELIYNGIKIHFRDSLLILPNSLRKLAKSFNVESKGIFPYDFSNITDLEYNGKVPNFKYFVDITKEEYNNYKRLYSNWSLKNETIKYCTQDCVTLYQIIDKFNTLIFDKFNLNIHRFMTLSSLALGIYRGNYLGNSKIPIITGKTFTDLKNSYTGGSTEMFIPFGTNVYGYDVNSLYPTVMKKEYMPVGNITFFEGDIRKVDKKAFGFFEVEITAPDNIKHPIIQTKVNTGNGLRTISPLGTWTDIIFSPEMDNALSLGYKIKIIKGYLFQKDIIFSEYIDTLYEIKQSKSKDDPMYLISKLLLNSLYGKFGMDYQFNEHLIISDNKLINLMERNYLISDIINLDNDKSLISFIKKGKLYESNIFDNSNYNISIGVASAITSYSRIYMSKFKNKDNYNLYYTDTDSIYIDKELDPKFVGKDLGQFKLEQIFTEATFVAPKVYGGIIDDNSQITKVKGFKDSIKYNILKSLLNKNEKLILNQEKWFRNIEEGNITIKQQIYTLLPTENKRQLIYKNNKMVGTKAFSIDLNRNLI
jgi:DNA polymerase type B, organellar and viral